MTETNTVRDPERAAFEAHLLAWTGRDMAYHIAACATGLEFAWSCWQTARPKRAAVGKIVVEAYAAAAATVAKSAVRI